MAVTTGLRKVFSESKLLVHVLVCCFGIASWVDINGTWVELPILVTYLPEGWTLPSQIVIISQIANIGPIIFAALVFCFKDKKLEKPVSAFIIVIGMISCLLMSFFWKETTFLFGQIRSTALLSLMVALATVDCTSSMAFLAFMACMKSVYLPAYFIGESLSGLLPSLIALGQGAGNIVCVNTSRTEANFTNGDWYNETVNIVYPKYETPRFSVQVFFLILFGLITISLVSYLLLNFQPYCKREHVIDSCYDLEKEVDELASNLSSYRVRDSYQLGGMQSKENLYENTHSKNAIDNPAFDDNCIGNSKSASKSDVLRENKDTEDIPMPTYCYLLFATALVNMQITSFLLSIQSYTSLPYGLNTYHLSAIITNIANPVACFVSLVLPVLNTSGITVLTVLGTCFGIYLTVLAFTSPTPPLVGTDAGGAIAVTSWAMASFLLTYAKVSIGGRLRRGGRRPMLWYGGFTQIGAAIGAVVAFLLVNVYKILKDAPFC